MSICHFCNLNKDKIIFVSDYCYVIKDEFPVSPNHLLIITKRHVASFFELNSEEIKDINITIHFCKCFIEHICKNSNIKAPDGYNIGINVGKAAGQSIMHCHIHIIPRYEGDMKDPKGGVRGVIPSKQSY